MSPRLVALAVAASIAVPSAAANAAYRAVTNPVDGCKHEVWTPMFDVRDGRLVVDGRFDYDEDCP